ncbi:30S ribosomal protein S15 [Candidatus Woesearchaeota archaeon]|nr:30S ribosomal protein S15 [Candidatus Woesearchaeota archaeon]MBW3016135.1 30S ribosomal protein S15 [Candidatus Woesearchaeota archaeon]
MAKMHSRGRGNAHSNKPLNPAKPTWIRYKPKEIELLIGKLSKEGKTSSEIGLILRDSYGVPSVKLLLGKTIQKILGEKKLLPELPEDLMSLIKKAVIIRKHMEKNRQDMTAIRGLQFTESKIKRLVKYYKETGKIADEWKYDPKSIKIYID